MHLLRHLALEMRYTYRRLRMSYKSRFGKSIRMERKYFRDQHRIHKKYHKIILAAAGPSLTKNITGEHPCPSLPELTKLELEQTLALANVTIGYLSYSIFHADDRAREIVVMALEQEMSQLRELITRAHEHDIPLKRYIEQYSWAEFYLSV